jgi:hypothetical protein
MRLGCGIGAWQLSLVRENLSSVFNRSGVLSSSKIKGIISGRLNAWQDEILVVKCNAR